MVSALVDGSFFIPFRISHTAEMVDRNDIELQIYYFVSWVYYENHFLVPGSNIEQQAGRFFSQKFFLGFLQVLSTFMLCELSVFFIYCNVKYIFLFYLSCVIYLVRILVNSHNVVTRGKGNDH